MDPSTGASSWLGPRPVGAGGLAPVASSNGTSEAQSLARRRADVLAIRTGPAQFSGPVVGPTDAYLTDCWTAVLGATQVLAFRRLHQLSGADVPADDLARSLGFSTLKGGGRLRSCLSRLELYGAITRAGNQIQVAPGLRYLTPNELRRAGSVVAGLHRAHLRARHLEPARVEALARDGARAMRRSSSVSMQLGAS